MSAPGKKEKPTSAKKDKPNSAKNDEAELIVDARVEYLNSKVLTSLKLKGDKCKKMLSNPDNRYFIHLNYM
jgi:hypothetical protein